MVSKLKIILSFSITAVALVVLFLFAVNTGSLKVTPIELFKGLFISYNENVATIFDLRFPRIFIAILGGAATAVSGVLLQAVMKNPLADPGIIGISSGASLTAVLITAFVPALYYFTPLFAFLGGMLAFILVYSLSWKGGLSPVRIILVGVAIEAMLSGIMSAFNSGTGSNYSGVASIVNANISMKTWDDFYKACDTLKSKNITPVSMDTADLGWLSNLWYSGLIGTAGEEGNKFMNTMYPTDYTSDLVVNATEQLQKMLKNYTTSDAAGGKYDTMATHFFNSEVAMLPNGPWMIPDFKSTDKAPEGFYDKVGIMLLPGSGMESVPTPGDMVGTKDPEKVKAAVAFLKFETTAENQLKALEMAGLQPVSSNIEVPDSLKESDPLMAEVLDIQSKAKYTYGQNQAYWYQNVIDTFSTQLPELAYGNMTAKEFCQKLTDAAKKN